MTDRLWSVVTLIGLWGWVACAVGLCLTAFPARGGFAGRRGLVWGGALLVLFVVWMVGMANA